MSTADCKVFLSQTFPGLPSKAWKRVTKFNDAAGNPVREFAHPQHPDPVFLVEKNGTLEVHDAAPARANAPSSKASKYVFSVVTDHSTGDTSPGEHLVIITKKSYWEKTGFVYDQPDETPGELMPEEWMAEDINECGNWLITSDLDENDLIVELLNLGFQSVQEFDDFLGGRSQNAPPLVNQRLTQALAPETTTAAVAGKPKI